MTPQSAGTTGSPQPEPDMDTVTAVATASSPIATNPNMLSVVQVCHSTGRLVIIESRFLSQWLGSPLPVIIPLQHRLHV